MRALIISSRVKVSPAKNFSISSSSLEATASVSISSISSSCASEGISTSFLVPSL